ncbi:MAG: hypothetical protein U0V56_01645 [Actinomycetota bacterium]
MERIRTIHWGTGAIGTRALAEALADPRFRVVGAVSCRGPERAREALASLGAASTVVAGVSLDEVVAAAGGADVVVLATQAHVRELEEQITAACRAGLHVVCIGEEVLHPSSADAGIGQRLLDEAIANGVSVLGTGINPGYLMDALPLVLTAPTRRWSRLHARRVSDLSHYGWTVLRGLGIGLTPEGFKTAKTEGNVSGHLGFRQSVAIIGEASGLQLTVEEDSAEPIVRSVPTPFANELVAPGVVIGVMQRCIATSTEGHTVSLEHPQRIGTADAEEPFGDMVVIDGDPPIRFEISPGIDGAQATVALMLNLAPVLEGLPPGLHSTIDAPLSTTAHAGSRVRSALVSSDWS